MVYLNYMQCYGKKESYRMNNDYEKIRKIILESLEELGVYIDDAEDDIDINEYGIVSRLVIQQIRMLFGKRWFSI